MRRDPKEYETKFLNDWNRRDFVRNKKQEEQAERTFFPRRKQDDAHPASVRFAQRHGY